jgi:hypothetical protein
VQGKTAGGIDIRSCGPFLVTRCLPPEVVERGVDD